ncbi:hypothetical protein Tcan_10652 [Toxocara canis]|uniref:Uncharacterized protein n=1 Tax=Toxocara canis TaxID=6265 RepID=A0A0B2VR77_TOXCA|nr:hypothetical protein Tcan_10652 [Toxocara canis]
MTLPNVSLSVFLTHEFRKYTAVLNPRFAVPASRGGVCSLSDGPLQVTKEKIVREVEEPVGGASVTVDIWSGKCIKDSFIAATIPYVGEGYLKNAFLGLKRLNGRHDAQTINTGGRIGKSKLVVEKATVETKTVYGRSVTSEPSVAACVVAFAL